MERTLKNLLQEQAKRDPDKTFIFWEDEEISYGEVLERAKRLAASFILRGLGKEDKVAVWARNRPEFVYLMFACALSGTVLVPINTRFKTEETQYILENSEARVLVTQPQFGEMLGAIRSRCPALEEVFLLDSRLPGTTAFDELYEPAEVVEREIGEEDPASLIYTSSTSGRPKGVILTHKNYVSNAAQLASACQMTAADRFLGFLPLFQVYGQVVSVYTPLYANASLVLLSRFSPREFLPRLAHYKATAFSGVPTVYTILNNLPDAESYDLSPLRFCVCGGAPMPVEVFEEFERKYKAFILEGYGLAEGTCASCLNPLTGRRKIGSIGLPLAGQAVKIVNEHGEEMQSGQVGEIVIRGDNVMKGYYRAPAETAAVMERGWLHTGDLGYRDIEGYFYIVGRKKDMIIRGGENIYPREIELVLLDHPKIAEAAVVGVPDKIWGEEVAAFIVIKEGEAMKSAEVQEYCQRRLADYKCPRLVFFWERLPKDSNGQIQKGRILEMHLQRSRRQ